MNRFRGPLASPNAIQRHSTARKTQLATIMHVATNGEISSWMTNKRHWIIRILFTGIVCRIVSTHKYKKSDPDPFFTRVPSKLSGPIYLRFHLLPNVGKYFHRRLFHYIFQAKNKTRPSKFSLSPPQYYIPSLKTPTELFTYLRILFDSSGF